MLTAYESEAPLVVKGREVHSFEVNLCERCGGLMPPYRRLIHCAKCVTRDPIDGSEIDSVRHWSLFLLDAADDDVLENGTISAIAKADEEAVNTYADHLYWIVKGEKLPTKDAVVIAIPPREKRFTLSGVERLASQAAAALSLEFFEGLEFAKEVPGYEEMSPEEKKRAIAGAMKAKKRLDEKNVFLVDDVMISGYTLREGARALRAAGANRVYGIVCGRGVTFLEIVENSINLG
jgi:predicted amidophosphoribosyltransferase